MSKKPKKAKVAKAQEGAEAGSEGEAVKGPSKIGAILPPLFAAGAAFALVTFLPSPDPVVMEAPAEDIHKAHTDDHDLGLDEHFYVVPLQDITLSIRDHSKLLKVGIALEMREDMSAVMDSDNARLRDAFMGYLRSIEIDQLTDPGFLPRMKAQLLRRAKLILGDGAVSNVLITDFLVR